MSSPPVGHSHRLPPWLFAGLAVMVLGLVGSLVLVAEQSIATNNRLTALEQYVAGKGAQRDAENATQNQRIDQAVCSVLDQLPAGGRLDIIRQQYGCGPGITTASPSSSPSAAASSSGATRPSQPAAPTANRAAPRPTPPPAPTAASANSSPRRTSAPSSAPAPTTAAPPAGPVTTVLCGLVPQLCIRQ